MFIECLTVSRYNMFLLLLFALLSTGAHGQCGPGCLFCTTANICTFCDYNGFVMSGISCKQYTNTNCTYWDQTGFCLLCSGNNYIDQTTGKCVAVPTANLISNCVIYSTAVSCNTCASGYVLGVGACNPTNSTITGCQVYNPTDTSKCRTCSASYILDQDTRQCIATSKLAGCAGYTQANCIACNMNFILNLNLYQNTALNFLSPGTMIRYIYNDETGYTDQGNFASCQAITALNCATYQSATKCSTCLPNFYMDQSKNCLPFPAPAIANCTQYFNNTVCVNCSVGFYLPTSQSCSPAPPTSTCANFSTSAATLVCVQCQNGFYLTANAACATRVNSAAITNCATPDPNADLCFLCATGFTLTTDRLACLTTINNCKTYASSTSSSTALTCLACASGLFYDAPSSSCQVGTVINCDVYSGSTCQTCLNGYYLNNNQCNAHPFVSNCVTYDQTNFDVCTTCDSTSFLFTSSNFCAPVTPIANCLSYASTTACSNCALGFYVDQNNNCSPILTPSNCLTVNNGQCTLCMPQYYLSSGSCVAPPVFYSQNCFNNTATGSTQLSALSCTYCNQGSIPFNFVNSYGCILSSNIPSPQVIPNCGKYLVSGTTYTCYQCVTGYVLVSPTQCGSVCPSGTALKAIEAYTNGTTTVSSFTIARVSVCVSTFSVANCVLLGPMIFPASNTAPGEMTYVCRSCASGFGAVINPGEVTVVNSLTSLQATTPISAHPGIQCVASASLTRTNSGVTTNSVIDYCQYYYQYNSNYGCYKCAFGYSGVVTAFTAANNKGHISKCVSVPNCQTTFLEGYLMTLTGLSKYQTVLGALYGCHVCSGGMIPFLAIDFTTSPGAMPLLAAFSLSSSPYGSGTGGSATACYTPTFTSFNINAASWAFPTNCALGIINTASVPNSLTSTSTNPAVNQAAVFCFACQPGYRRTLPTTDTNAPGAVIACTAITNCALSVWLNSCSQCNIGYGYRYTPSTGTVSFDVCIFSPDPGNNCFAINDAVLPNICVYCNPGYVLNWDNVCEQIQSFQCSDPSMSLAQSFAIVPASPNFAVGLYLQPVGPGCQLCQIGYASVRVSQNHYVCSVSSYFQGNVYVSGTKFINGCQNYFMNNAQTSIACVVCQSGMVVSINGQCYSGQQFPNCLRVSDTTPSNLFCTVCTSDYVVVMGACQLKAITNCATYSYLPTSQNQVCSACARGYFLSSNTCFLTNVLNCILASSANVCTTCASGYVLLSLTNGASYCYPIPPSLNCLAASNAFSSGTFSCTSCNSSYIINNSAPKTANVTFCGQVGAIPNCIAYDIKPVMLQSSFVCKECGSGYWLNGTVCVARINMSTACRVYTVTADTCSSCIQGYYVSPSTQNCVQNPTGMPGCINYSSATTCTGCAAGMFLLSNTCYLVGQSSAIANCQFYSGPTTCATCAYGYFLSVDGSCTLATATNCLTFQSVSACATCPPRMGLRQQSNGLSCVPITDNNCVTFSLISPFNCFVCASEYYPANGICSLVQSAINFCLIYDTATTCLTCNSGYVLGQNRTSCSRTTTLLAMFDPQCATMAIAPTPVCNKCGPGYYFLNQSCAACMSIGCYSCSSENLTACIGCRKGFYQTATGACVANPLSSNNTNGTAGGNGTNFTSTTGSLARLMCSTIVSILAIMHAF